jgi:UDP-N-acetylglucosamine 2-epimerase (non-hydrolysing)
MVVVYGDVNSTLAVTLVAAKSGVPVAHVEAGLRSFDRSMPEEVNRLVTDRLSDVLLATSADAVAHLAAEGTPAAHIHLVGNPMIDTLMKHLPAATSERTDAYGLPDRYAVATLHRPANVDAPAELKLLVDALHEVATTSLPVAIPVHPRGKHRLDEAGMFEHPGILELPPLGYLEFITLMRQSTLVITDSGGVQEETTILGIPCFTVRPNTERPITITHGTNRLSPPDRLAAEVRAQAQAGRPTSWRTPPLWDGLAGRRIADVLLDYLESGH